MAHADDADFISMVQHKDVSQVQQVPKKYNLLINNDKKAYTNIKRETNKEEKV